MFHLVKRSTETQGVIFGLCDLRLWKSTPCLLETTLLWSVLQTSFENLQTPFTKYLHQHAPGMSCLHSPTLTRGLSWWPHLKNLMFPKEQRFDDWYNSFCFCQRYVIDSEKKRRHKLISQIQPCSPHSARCPILEADCWIDIGVGATREHGH